MKPDDKEYYEFWLLLFKGMDEILNRLATDEGVDTTAHNDIWQAIVAIEKKLNINQHTDYFKGV